MIFPITFCSWVYAIQSSDQHTFQKTFCIVVVIDWIWLDQVLTLYWQRVKTNYRLGTGSEFNYRLSSGSGFNYKLCIGSGGCEYSPGCKLQIVLGQVWRSHKMQLIFYGCFNFLNIYKLQNANEILCWMLQLTQDIQLQKSTKYKWGC